MGRNKNEDVWEHFTKKSSGVECNFCKKLYKVELDKNAETFDFMYSLSWQRKTEGQQEVNDGSKFTRHTRFGFE